MPGYLREAEPIKRDIDGIQRLIQIGVSRGHLQPRTSDEIREIIDQRHFYVVDQGMGIAGCAALEVYTPRLAEVRSVAVLPFFRRSKVGTHLVERCIEEARRLGIKEVLAITDQSKFFASVGFRDQLRGQRPLFLKLD